LDGLSVASKTRASAERVEQFLTELGQIGRDSHDGWSRLGFGAEERAAHALFARWMQEIGLHVSTDAVGNTYAEVASSTGGPALVVGSHLDTVPNGGNYDGAAGIAAAVEAARLVAARGGLRKTFRVVVFSCEEGARFGAPCVGSRVATGAFTSKTLDELRDPAGRSVAECAAEVGLHPEDAVRAVWQPGSVEAFLELHIEQGRVLEDRELPLAVVDTIGGSTRIELTFKGQTDHSGATPMRLRKDALAGASEFILEVEREAAEHPTTVGTVGRLQIDSGSGSLTTVPGEVVLALDVRDIDPIRQRELAESLLDQASRICSRRGLQLSAELLSDQSPVVLHNALQDVLASAARSLDVPFCVMPSGASHDAAHIAKIAPAGMLFIPCRGGVSHAPDEWADPQHVARGADVLVGALLRLQDRDLL
jgi:allantoate deiminase